MKMADAKQKRNEQLKRWIGSETDLEPPVVKRQKTKVKFDDGAVFLAACSSGDTDEVLKLLHRGADINYANVDGLTALHQVCAPLAPTPRALALPPGPGLSSAPGLPRPGRLPAAEGGRALGREGEDWRREGAGPEAPSDRSVEELEPAGFRGRGERGLWSAGGPGARMWACCWDLGSGPRRVGVVWLCLGPDVSDILGKMGDAEGEDPQGA